MQLGSPSGRSVSTASCLELLLRDHNGMLRRGTGFYAAVQLLVDHGAAEHDEALFLISASREGQSILADSANADVLSDMLIASVPGRRASEVLWQYIFALGGGGLESRSS